MKFIIVLLFALWCGGSSWYYVCRIKQVCYERPVPPPPDLRPVVFAENDNTAVLRRSFPRYRDSILNLLQDDRNLEIVGLYLPTESAPNGFPDMGMARAAAVRNRLNAELPDDRIILTSRPLTADPRDSTELMELIEFGYPAREREVVQLEDRTRIYFPPGSVEQIENEAIQEYLRELAERLKNGTETVRIVGHTDNLGDPDVNQRLGLRRAKMIRDVLRRRGVPRRQILTESPGQEEPIADNATEEGRQKNRRVEVIVEE